MANKENIRKWVEALRSGKYKQTRKGLRDAMGFCCLGVACEVAIANGVPLVVGTPNRIDSVWWSYDETASSLPGKVSDWLGLSGSYAVNPILDVSGKDRRASDLNDIDLADFTTIANCIEATYLSD